MGRDDNEVTRKQFALMHGWSPSYVTKLADEGRLILTVDKKHVLVAESNALIEATGGGRPDVANRHKEGRGVSQETSKPGPAPVDEGLSSLKRSRATSEARRMAAQADKEELERDKLAGSLLDREDVNFAMDDFGTIVRTHMENMSDALAPIVLPLKTMEEVRAAISDYGQQVLTDLAEAMRRRKEEWQK